MYEGHTDIASLLKSMQPQQNMLYGILDYCKSPLSTATLSLYLKELEQFKRSIFSVADLCRLMEEAGGIRKVAADGGDLSGQQEMPCPEFVGGTAYISPRESLEVMWLTTEAGAEALSRHQPQVLLEALFADELEYLIIYERILLMCSCEGGAESEELKVAVDDDPLVQKPRKYVSRFCRKLEDCGALLWQGTWVATEVGQQGIEVIKTLLQGEMLASSNQISLESR